MAGCLRRAGALNLAKLLVSPSVATANSRSAEMLVKWTPSTIGGGQPYALRHGPTKRWEELPQPNLKPIGPEDYRRWRYFLNKPKPEPRVHEVTPEDVQISEEVFRQINGQLETDSVGRLFAVVHVGGKQFKITANDIIVVQGTFVPANGDVIRLEKVLAVGSSDFTLLGRPLLGKDAVKIEATVIEKTFSHIVTHFRMKRRKQYRRINFYRIPYTMLRINDIMLTGRVNEIKEVENVEGRVIT